MSQHAQFDLSRLLGAQVRNLASGHVLDRVAQIGTTATKTSMHLAYNLKLLAVFVVDFHKNTISKLNCLRNTLPGMGFEPTTPPSIRAQVFPFSIINFVATRG